MLCLKKKNEKNEDTWILSHFVLSVVPIHLVYTWWWGVWWGQEEGKATHSFWHLSIPVPPPPPLVLFVPLLIPATRDLVSNGIPFLLQGGWHFKWIMHNALGIIGPTLSCPPLSSHSLFQFYCWLFVWTSFWQHSCVCVCVCIVWIWLCGYGCVCMCVCVCVCVCVCACLWCGCVCLWYLCVWERERENACVPLCERERGHPCVWVWVRVCVHSKRAILGNKTERQNMKEN